MTLEILADGFESNQRFVNALLECGQGDLNLRKLSERAQGLASLAGLNILAVALKF